MRFHVVVDDLLSERGFSLQLLPGHGLSILIEKDNLKLLFDTGSSEKLLLYNMRRMGFDINEIDYLFISSWKKCHAGAVNEVFRLNPRIKAFAPPVTSSITLVKPKDISRIIFIKSTEPREILPGVYTTGIYCKKWYCEHALFLKATENILAVFLGCSTYGFSHFIKRTEKTAKKYIIGGLHLSKLDFIGFKLLKQLVAEENVEGVLPLHCTAPDARKEIIKWKGILQDTGVGIEFAL